MRRSWVQFAPEGSEGEGGALRDNPVAGEAKLSGAREVQPGVQPCSHSTNRGFNCRREVGAFGEGSYPCGAVSGSWWEDINSIA